MMVTGNLASFFSEPTWVFLALAGATSSIPILFAYRRFLNSLDRIRYLFVSENEFQMMKDKLVDYLTKKVYLLISAFWLIINLLNFTGAGVGWFSWWWFYNEPLIVTVYYYIANFQSMFFGGIFMGMLPIGLTLAYRHLTLNAAFKKDLLASDWMGPFKGFRNLITLAMLLAILNVLFIPLAYGDVPPLLSYSAGAIIVVPTMVFPHYYFHRFFSEMKRNQHEEVRNELSKVSAKTEKETFHRILLLLEEGRIARKKAWLIDVETLGEILIVALMHVLLVEILAALLHA
ncbi:MAG: hypothetical protein ACFE7E_04565 [Candidatus Hodarchaeota archaeon]